VQGLVESMDGDVTARRSDLGGLAVDITLPSVPPESAIRTERTSMGGPS
jgi:hypothetical protein